MAFLPVVAIHETALIDQEIPSRRRQTMILPAGVAGGSAGDPPIRPTTGFGPVKFAPTDVRRLQNPVELKVVRSGETQLPLHYEPYPWCVGQAGYNLRGRISLDRRADETSAFPGQA